MPGTLIETREKAVEGIRRELHALVRESGLTQRQIEQANGFASRYLSQVLKGRITLTVRHLVGILAAVDVPLEELVKRVLGRPEEAEELREKMARYDAALAQLEERGLLEPEDGP